MEASEEQTPDIAPEEDPFAGVESDPLAGQGEEEPLPPGVEQGSLGGTDLSEEPDPEEPTEPAEEPAPIPEVDGAGEADTEPEFEIDPAPAESPEAEADVPLPEEEPEPEPEPEPETPVETSEEGKKEDPPAEAEEKKKPKRRKPAKKKAGSPQPNGKPKTGDREYVILKLVGQGKTPSWAEAFDREDPNVPTVLPARHGEAALRRAYHLLTEGEDKPADFVLVATPKSYFQPKAISGRVHRQTAITID